MSVLVDTSFYVALQNSRDPNHARARTLLKELMEGRHGEVLTSDFIVAEILNYASLKLRVAERRVSMMRELLGRSGAVWMSMAHVDEQVFGAAADLFESGGAAMGLSFTDCTSIIMMRRMGIGTVASFDGGFDALADRLC